VAAAQTSGAALSVRTGAPGWARTSRSPPLVEGTRTAEPIHAEDGDIIGELYWA
jgi:hypothetical protein